MANPDANRTASPASSSGVLPPGSIAPDFTLKTQDRADWSLAEHVKKGDVVLSFYPFAFTSTCSVEMKCVNDELKSWKDKGANVVGISCDSFAANKAWADQMGLKQVLLSDMHRAVCRAYGLYWADLNVSQRGTIVIGQSADGRGKIKWSQARPPSEAMNWDEVSSHLG